MREGLCLGQLVSPESAQGFTSVSAAWAHSRFLRNAESTPEQSLIPNSGGGGDVWEVKGAAAKTVVSSHQSAGSSPGRGWAEDRFWQRSTPSAGAAWAYGESQPQSVAEGLLLHHTCCLAFPRP